MGEPVNLRPLRYFVVVAEELHFGRAAERLHMSQSPLSRAIRELERELGLVLFIRTTRRVELTPAGVTLLEGARSALYAIEVSIQDARRADGRAGEEMSVGHAPLCLGTATRIVEEIGREQTGIRVRRDEDMTATPLARVAANELDAAVVLSTPAAGRRHRLRVEALRDEPLLAALPAAHPFAGRGRVPLAAFVAERVLLPRAPGGEVFTTWLRSQIRAAGFELERILEAANAGWDRRLIPVAKGEAVAALVAGWPDEPVPGGVTVPPQPRLTLPAAPVTAPPPTAAAAALVRAARARRDAEGWLTTRAPGPD